MSMLSLERRRSNPRAIYAACMIGLSIGIPALIVAPRIIEAKQGAVVPVGAHCTYQGDPQWVVDSHTDGGYIILDHRTYERREVSRGEVTIDPKDIPAEYYWYHSLFGG